MTRKQERTKFARHLRKLARLTLPESVAVAKFAMSYGERTPPELLTPRLESACSEPGCCYRTYHYLTLKSGAERPVECLYSEF